MQLNTGSGRKRTDKAASTIAIKKAALSLFIQKGYRDTTTDEIAALAGVSKQTIYRSFRDKESLFTTLIRDSVERATAFLERMSLTLEADGDVGRALKDVARKYIETVFQPPVLQLRHLLISETRNFPELAALYYREVPQRTLDALTVQFHHLQNQGELRDAGSRTMARHFAALLMMLPLDKAMFGLGTSQDDLEREAIEGVEAFLSAYGTTD